MYVDVNCFAALELQVRGFFARNMSRERFLPDEKTLEKIIRCEAYLYRQPYQALHELEALKTKRSGAAPLARLEVQGRKS